MPAAIHFDSALHEANCHPKGPAGALSSRTLLCRRAIPYATSATEHRETRRIAFVFVWRERNQRLPTMAAFTLLLFFTCAGSDLVGNARKFRNCTATRASEPKGKPACIRMTRSI